MLSLLASRVASRLPIPSVTLGRIGVIPITSRAILSSQTRSFSTTPRLELLIKVAMTSTKPSASRKVYTAAKSPGSKQPAAKKRVAAKKKSAPKKPKRLVITKDMKPPPRSSTAYIIFFMDFLRRRVKVSSLAEMATVAREASNEWKNLEESQRQTFLDTAANNRVEYLKKRNEYFKHVDPAVLRELNRRNVAKGKLRIIRPRTDSEVRPPKSGYMRFCQDFRQTPEGKEIQSSGRRAAVNVVKRAAELWKAMPDAEKEKYNQETETEKKAYQASHFT